MKNVKKSELTYMATNPVSFVLLKEIKTLIQESKLLKTMLHCARDVAFLWDWKQCRRPSKFSVPQAK